MKKTSQNTKIPKREHYLTWDDYFMGIALLSAQRSKDPNTQVGACVVSPNKRIIGIGYNGFPAGCSDDVLPWSREGDFLDTKYPYVCHAELNAVINSRETNLQGCTLYVALFPCNECAKIVIQSGIKEIVYLSDKYADLDITKAAKRMFDLAGVKYSRLKSKVKSLNLDFSAEN
jgi:dCMP deaminase